MPNLTEYIAKALEPLECIVSIDGITEKRLPLGRLERASRVKVKYYPRPAEQVLGFHAGEEPPDDYRLFELSKKLELVDTPDGLLRGRDITCAIKDGAAVAGVSYTEWLCEAGPRRPQMDAIKLTVSPPPAGR
jgi:hypothetical protein